MGRYSNVISTWPESEYAAPSQFKKALCFEKLENYDQAWTMVQFLAHAENGKYQGAFVKFMRAIATGPSASPWSISTCITATAPRI